MTNLLIRFVHLLTLLLVSTALPVKAELILVNSEAGSLHSSGSNEVLTNSTRVEGQLGVKFGVRFTVTNKSDNGNAVKYIYLTPGITQADGSRQDKIELTKDLSADSSVHTMAFEFTDSRELRYGEWTMMVFEQDRLLVKAVFDVVIPQDNLDIP